MDFVFWLYLFLNSGVLIVRVPMLLICLCWVLQTWTRFFTSEEELRRKRKWNLLRKQIGRNMQTRDMELWHNYYRWSTPQEYLNPPETGIHYLFLSLYSHELLPVTNNYQTILKRCFLGTTCMVMSGTLSNLLPHKVYFTRLRTGNIILCHWRFVPTDTHTVLGKHFLWQW